MAGKVKTWVWVVVAIFVVGILGLVAMAGVGFYFFSQHIDTHAATPATAARDFAAIKTRFKDQQPLIELDERGRFLRANTDRTPPPDVRAPQHLYIQAFDSNDEQVVRLNVPFWLLRLKTGNASIDLNGRRMDLEDLKLTVDDLERFGPILIVDHTGRDGDRVLVWTQ
jgi:hypothetical protein